MKQGKEIISVIVPIFNVGDVLGRCIESIVTQTYKNIEIILVDDGSRDNSGAICDEWAERDRRITVIHKKNGGAASARNYGLEIAKGEYIGFVDSDDYIAADMYELLLADMESDIDIACCGTATLYPDRMKLRPVLYDNAPRKMVFTNQESIKERLLLRYLSFSPCDKLFRRELFNSVRFPAGRVCEDLPVIYECVKKSQKVINIGKVKYFYCYRENSVSRKKFSRERISYILFARDIFRDVYHSYPLLREEAEARYITNVVSIMYQIKQYGMLKEYKKIYMRLKKLLIRRQFNILMNKYLAQYLKVQVLELIWR